MEPSVPVSDAACALTTGGSTVQSRPNPERSHVGWRRLLTALAAITLGCTAAAIAQSNVPAVAAASDLKFPLEEIAAEFRATTKREVKLVFGSSGNFFRQIEQGAPFQLYMSADETFVLKLAQGGRLENKGDLYGTGRLVLFVPHASRLQVDPKFQGLKAALAAGEIRRFAIANPEHAPYGRAAEQALIKLGLWEIVRPRLVLGENVSQAAQFASSGTAEGGIFAYSLVLAPQVGKLGRYVLIPEDLHEPLHQRMALVKGAGETARMLYGYLQAPAARAVFRRYGFVLPGEQ
jgi:molybdate transport system substrate-binding protein